MKSFILGFIFLLPVFVVAAYIFTAGFSSAVNIAPRTAAPVAEISYEKDDDKPNLRDARLLIVKIYPDGTLALNRTKTTGTDALKKELLKIFEVRVPNGVFSDSMKDRDDVPDAERIERTVWILAARGVNKEKITEVRQAIESAGAKPVKMLTGPAYRKLLDEPFIDPNQPDV